MTGALSSHYARALANAVFAENSGLAPEDAVAQLQSAASAIGESKDLLLALYSPAVSKGRKNAVISRIADQMGLHRLIRNFLLVVVSHRRIGELRSIAHDFELVVDERTGWIPAEIFSAHELDAAEREHIERVLGSRLGKFIRAHYKVDPSLIGGIRAHVASREYDATVRGRLEGMRQRLVSRL